MHLIYCAHAYGGNHDNLNRAAEITRKLQLADDEAVYICPLMVFSHLYYGEIGYDTELDMCMELLSKCNELLVLSDLSTGVKAEIEFASRHGIPISFWEK